MVVDNFELINSLLTFSVDKDRFYHLQIIRRGKDHKNLAAANRVIKTYYVDSPDYILKRKEEIINLCEMFGARAYINLNPKSYKKVTLGVIAEFANRANMGDYKKIYKCWDTVTGQQKPSKKEDVRWIVDIDFPNIQVSDKTIVDELVKIWVKMWERKKIPASEEAIHSVIEEYIFAKIPTKGGYHLITSPFDIQEFNKVFENKIDVHKNNPTILYIPEIKQT